MKYLRTVFAQETAPMKHLGTAIHKFFKTLGGVEFEIPQREAMCKPPRFDWQTFMTTKEKA